MPVTEKQVCLAEAFDAARPRLIRVAYAILGSHSEAEDVVADAWLRLSAADEREAIVDIEAWGVVAVSRMAVDVLRSARVRRESYVGPWLPEPSITADDPAEQITLDDQVSYALLVVLENLPPAERVAFVLHDLFGIPFPEIAATFGRSPAAVRQLASRARRHIRDRADATTVDPTEHDRVVRAFAAASSSGNLAVLTAALDPDAVLVSDGGGFVSSARHPVRGAEQVARFVLNVLAMAQPDDRVMRVRVNGLSGFALFRGNVLVTIVSLTVSGGTISRVDAIRTPEKLPRGIGPLTHRVEQTTR